jgi:hypothetical protein
MGNDDVIMAQRPVIRQKDWAIRETNGKWLNSDVFRKEGIKFNRTKTYCIDPPGTPAFKDYWDEQLDRCKNGYEIGGWKVTGNHYSYLNFCEIKKVINNPNGKTSKKIVQTPDFWDGDYDYYWCLELAKNGVSNPESVMTTQEEKDWLHSLDSEERKKEHIRIVDELLMRVKPHEDYLEGGNHMIIGKSRRKGYSYKNADICKNVYNTIRESLTVIGAYDKKYLYPKGTMGMASTYLSYLNKNTAWAKAREYTDKVDIKTASFKKINTLNNVSYEAGYLSTIMALTFGDNPDAARGKDALYVLFEEAGKFPNLKDSVNATAPGLAAGKYITGQILVFGTGGDMESGTVDFAHMFYNPVEFGFMPFYNIWDENAENSFCGFFHPVYINMEGYYDEQGNSDVEGAKAEEFATRERLRKNASSSLVIQARAQEYPMNPSEAFLTVSTNDFPIVELRRRKNIIERENIHLKLGQPVTLTRKIVGEEGNRKTIVVAEPILNLEAEGLWTYRPKTADLRGVPIIYKYPISNPPKGLYKIGFDPYRQQNSSAIVPSLASIIVYKGSHKFSYDRDTIVAQYVGRPYNPDDVNRIAEMFAELYNAEIMYENEVTHVKNYFEKKNKLHLLAAQPDNVISKNIKASTVARVYGCHMIEKLKDAGEKYIKKWLLTERDFDEYGDAVYNLDLINDPALLEELILYNRKGNFDRVMSLMMLMFQIEEDEEDKVYGDDDEDKDSVNEIEELLRTQFQKAA